MRSLQGLTKFLGPRQPYLLPQPAPREREASIHGDKDATYDDRGQGEPTATLGRSKAIGRQRRCLARSANVDVDPYWDASPAGGAGAAALYWMKDHGPQKMAWASTCTVVTRDKEVLHRLIRAIGEPRAYPTGCRDNTEISCKGRTIR